MKQIIGKNKLRDLILTGITSEELNSKYNYSRVTSMNGMFEGCKNLKSIPKLDTSNVTDMGSMFSECNNLKEIPLLNTSNVENMYGMFLGCKNLESIPLLDTSKIKNMGAMFDGCDKLDTRKFYLNAVKHNNKLLDNDCDFSTIPEELQDKYGNKSEEFIKNLYQELLKEERDRKEEEKKNYMKSNPFDLDIELDLPLLEGDNKIKSRQIKKDIETSGINLF